MNRFIKIFIYFLSLFIVCESFKHWVGSRCGFPGLPHETKVEPEKRIYEDGEEVKFSCPDDKIYLKTQTKKCVAGVWTGPRSTCGFFIRNQLMRVKIINIDKNETVVEMDTSNYTSQSFPTSFYEGKGNTVRFNNSHLPHKWLFEFSSPLFFDFFLLNVRIPKIYSQISPTFNEIDGIRVKAITILNEPNRNCSLDFSTRQKHAKIFWFWCTESTKKFLNESLSISFITYGIQPIKMVGLHQVYLTKLQYCGLPQVPLLARYVPSNDETEQIECNPEVSIPYSPTANVSELKMDSYHQKPIDCVDNPYWAGYPKCIPKKYCELNLNDTQEEIASVKNAYILDDKTWFAIDGTTVQFNCKKGFELIFDSQRTCLHNSTWDQTSHICRPIAYKESESSKDSNFFLSMGFIGPTIAILIVIIITVITVLVMKIKSYNKKLKSDRRKDNLRKDNLYDDTNENEDYSEVKYYESTNYENNEYENRYENKFPTQQTSIEYDGVNDDPYYLKINSSYKVQTENNTGNPEDYIPMTKQESDKLNT